MRPPARSERGRHLRRGIPSRPSLRRVGQARRARRRRRPRRGPLRRHAPRDPRTDVRTSVLAPRIRRQRKRLADPLVPGVEPGIRIRGESPGGDDVGRIRRRGDHRRLRESNANDGVRVGVAVGVRVRIGRGGGRTRRGAPGRFLLPRRGGRVCRVESPGTMLPLGRALRRRKTPRRARRPHGREISRALRAGEPERPDGVRGDGERDGARVGSSRRHASSRRRIQRRDAKQSLARVAPIVGPHGSPRARPDAPRRTGKGGEERRALDGAGPGRSRAARVPSRVRMVGRRGPPRGLRRGASANPAGPVVTHAHCPPPPWETAEDGTGRLVAGVSAAAMSHRRSAAWVIAGGGRRGRRWRWDAGAIGARLLDFTPTPTARHWVAGVSAEDMEAEEAEEAAAMEREMAARAENGDAEANAAATTERGALNADVDDDDFAEAAARRRRRARGGRRWPDEPVETSGHVLSVAVHSSAPDQIVAGSWGALCLLGRG